MCGGGAEKNAASSLATLLSYVDVNFSRVVPLLRPAEFPPIPAPVRSLFFSLPQPTAFSPTFYTPYAVLYARASSLSFSISSLLFCAERW